jgi:hypothetical protein
LDPRDESQLKTDKIPKSDSVLASNLTTEDLEFTDTGLLVRQKLGAEDAWECSVELFAWTKKVTDPEQSKHEVVDEASGKLNEEAMPVVN